MGTRKNPVWVAAQVDQRMAEIRDECDVLGIDLLDTGVGLVVKMLLASIENAQGVELSVESAAWKELTK